ncbi:MAG: hypothetical protein FJX64_10115 [Alphaproteobacteria bacterium]|nr:hypothetical protein [Alphaproteobacteria bacterium]
MRTFSLLAQKGGAGMTTLAVHLAVLAESLGERVAIIDTDPQRSAADWWRARKLPRPAMAECEPKNLPKAIESAKKRGMTLCIVDTPPHAGQFAYLVAEAVNFNLIPCRPAPFDLRAIGKTVDIIAQLNAPAGIVINAAPANRGDTEMPVTIEARKVLARYNLPVSPVAIIDRPVYQHPMEDGRTYIEHFPTGKPATDIAALWAWVQQQMGVAPKARPNADSPVRPKVARVPANGDAPAANAAKPQGPVRQPQSAAAKAAGPVRPRPADQSGSPPPIAARGGR